MVIKQGVFDLVFHPYGWIKPEQVVELIDHAVAKHGKKVKFLTFREALERLNKNLLLGQPLAPENGEELGRATLLDIDGDAYLDLVISDRNGIRSRGWRPIDGAWSEAPALPGSGGKSVRSIPLFMLIGHTVGFSFLPDGIRTLKSRTLDIDGDGRCEQITAGLEGIVMPIRLLQQPPPNGQPLLPEPLGFGLPPGARLLDDKGRDAGLRFIDLDEDGQLDVDFSNDQEYGIYLFDSPKRGWTRKVMAGKAGEPGALPKIVRDGTNNGFFVHCAATSGGRTKTRPDCPTSSIAGPSTTS